MTGPNAGYGKRRSTGRSLIQIDEHREAAPARADIGGFRQQEIRPKLVLQAHAELVVVRISQLRINRVHLVERQRPSGEHILERPRTHHEVETEMWRVEPRQRVQVEDANVVEEPVAAADDRRRQTERLPGGANARGQVVAIRMQNPGTRHVADADLVESAASQIRDREAILRVI